MKILKTMKHITHVENLDIEYLRIRWKMNICWIAIVGNSLIMCSPNRTALLERLYMLKIEKENS